VKGKKREYLTPPIIHDTISAVLNMNSLYGLIPDLQGGIVVGKLKIGSGKLLITKIGT
jgi:hypothetical protein